MSVYPVSLLLSFGCSIHCILFSVLSIVFPFISIKHTGLIHTFDLLFIIMSIFVSIFIFVRFVYLPKVDMKFLPLTSSIAGSSFLLISFFIISPTSFFFQTFGSLLLAISNFFYIHSHKHHKKCSIRFTP